MLSPVLPRYTVKKLDNNKHALVFNGRVLPLEYDTLEKAQEIADELNKKKFDWDKRMRVYRIEYLKDPFGNYYLEQWVSDEIEHCPQCKNTPEIDELDDDSYFQLIRLYCDHCKVSWNPMQEVKIVRVGNKSQKG